MWNVYAIISLLVISSDLQLGGFSAACQGLQLGSIAMEAEPEPKLLDYLRIQVEHSEESDSQHTQARVRSNSSEMC